MSTTYSIVCDECRERLWIGQRDYLYNTDDTGLADFLHDHTKHQLRFVCDLVDGEWNEYADVDSKYASRAAARLREGEK